VTNETFVKRFSLLRACGILLSSLLTAGAVPLVAQAQSAVPEKKSDAIHELSATFQSLAKHVSPAIVEVMVTGYGAPDEDDPRASSAVGRERSLGAGIIVESDGYIITNYHVVKGADRVRVLLTPPSAEGFSKQVDLAVLKVEATGLPTIPIGRYEQLQKGQIVLAFGSPEGLENSVSFGLVSSVLRQPDPNSPMVYIQTDAAINPGNSGGPLLNWHGEVIGINTMIASNVGQSAGIGFAIPVNTAKAVLNDLVTLGRVRRPALGVRTIPITPELADQMGLAADNGLLIVQVVPGGAAERSGLRGGTEHAYLGNIPIMVGGDLIVAIDGQAVQDQQALSQVMNNHRAGDTVRLTIYRGKKKMDVNVALGEAREQV
jgi:S1-C subfamily serine protease